MDCFDACNLQECEGETDHLFSNYQRCRYGKWLSNQANQTFETRTKKLHYKNVEATFGCDLVEFGDSFISL